MKSFAWKEWEMDHPKSEIDNMEEMCLDRLIHHFDNISDHITVSVQFTIFDTPYYLFFNYGSQANIS